MIIEVAQVGNILSMIIKADLLNLEKEMIKIITEVVISIMKLRNITSLTRIIDITKTIQIIVRIIKVGMVRSQTLVIKDITVIIQITKAI